MLLVVPDATRAGAIARGVHAANFVPVLAFSRDQALRCLALDSFSLVVLDLSHADESAQAAVSFSSGEVPMVVVGGSSSDAIVPLVAEEHLASAATAEEIVARAVASATIQRPVPVLSLRWGELELDVERRSARWAGQPLHLTVIEFRIMEVLAFAAGSVVSAEDLVRRVWGDELCHDRERVEAHVARIRRKLEPDPSRPVFLLTVRGEGHRLAEEEPRDAHIDLTRFEADGQRPAGVITST